jgi:hypothetical protein
MEWTNGVAIESVAALLFQKARRRITGRVSIRGMVNTEITAETMANGDIMFETQEWSILGADRAKKAS